MNKLILFLLLLIAAPAFAQEKYTPQDLLLPANLKQIDEAIAERDSLKIINIELNRQIQIYQSETDSYKEIIKVDRNMLLNEKKLRLSVLEALAAARTTKRPLILKIITLSIVRDKKDKDVEKSIADLKEEISGWK